MEQTFNWTIAQLERNSDNGFIVTVHWRYSLSEDSFFAETYSVLSFTQESEEFIPFEQITEADVIGWLESSMNMEEMQASLQLQIERQKNPPILKGLPWNN